MGISGMPQVNVAPEWGSLGELANRLAIAGNTMLHAWVGVRVARVLDRCFPLDRDRRVARALNEADSFCYGASMQRYVQRSLSVLHRARQDQRGLRLGLLMAGSSVELSRCRIYSAAVSAAYHAVDAVLIASRGAEILPSRSPIVLATRVADQLENPSSVLHRMSTSAADLLRQECFPIEGVS